MRAFHEHFFVERHQSERKLANKMYDIICKIVIYYASRVRFFLIVVKI